ncbi:hypothetical protein, partial [Ruminococcus sp. 5_1_39BFAA]|uniref:hypothetical protein n=1 Tax=Ruminococcus sp. 5_1_39BFAA TaxID=457412 RepID=UPI003569180F
IRIVISEFLPKKSYFLPETQTILHYRSGKKYPSHQALNKTIIFLINNSCSRRYENFPVPSAD